MLDGLDPYTVNVLRFAQAVEDNPQQLSNEQRQKLAQQIEMAEDDQDVCDVINKFKSSHPEAKAAFDKTAGEISAVVYKNSENPRNKDGSRAPGDGKNVPQTPSFEVARERLLNAIRQSTPPSGSRNT